MKRILSSLPIGIILIDMLYGFALNISQSLQPHQSNPINDDLPVSPDIAFDSLQTISNGGMILIIGFGLVVLLQLNYSVLKKQVLSIGIFRTLGLLAVLAFSIPSLYEWFWALAGLLTGKDFFNFSNPRYFIVSLCQPIIAVLCLIRLFNWYTLQKKTSIQQST